MGRKHHLWSCQDNLLPGQPARMGLVVVLTSLVRYFLQDLEAVHYPSLPCCSCRCVRMWTLSYHQHGLIMFAFRAAKISAKKYILILGWAEIGHAPLKISGFLCLLLCAFYSCSLSFLTMFFLTVFCPSALVKAAERMKLEWCSSTQGWECVASFMSFSSVTDMLWARSPGKLVGLVKLCCHSC